MITWAQAHQRAAILASELHADLEIHLDRPVDVFDAVDRLGIVLAFAPIGRVSGMYLPGGLSIGILINSEHPRTRQRFSAAHELGHHKFEHSIEIDQVETEFTRDKLNNWTDEEKEAEAFGAWFLMPRRLLRVGLKELGFEQLRDPTQGYALSLWLGTSWSATTRQLAATRLITRSQEDSWLRIQPREIKSMIAGHRTPPYFRNDVWRLDEGARERHLSAVPGDRIVLTLDEIPSSGYMWRFKHLPSEIRLVADSAVDDWEPQEYVPKITSIDEDAAGQTSTRSFLLEVMQSIESNSADFELVQDREWDSASPEIARFDVSLAIQSPLRGVQVSSDQFAASI